MSESNEDSDESNDTSIEQLARALHNALHTALTTGNDAGLSLPLPLVLQRLFQPIFTTELNGETFNQAKMFLPCENESESGMLEKRMKEWNSTYNPEVQGQFSQFLTKRLGLFLKEDFKGLFQKRESLQPPFPYSDFEGTLMENLMKLLQNPSVQSSATCINEILTEVFKQARTCQSATSDVPSDYNHNYILDLSAIHSEHLKFLLQLFTGAQQNQGLHESLKCLMQYVPAKPVHRPGVSGSSDTRHCANCKHLAPSELQSCHGCGKKFCTLCPLSKTKIPSLGHTQKVLVCPDCLVSYKEQERDDWIEKSMELLVGDGDENIQPAFACFLMGLHATECNQQVTLRQVNKFAKQLILQEMPELALPLLSAASMQSEVQSESIRAHVMASKALEALAFDPNTLSQEQIIMLKAAKAECEAATKVSTNAVEIPDLSARIRSLQKTISIIECEDLRQLQRAKQTALLKMQQAWKERKWDVILKMVSDRAVDHLIRADQRNPTMEAIKDLLKARKDDLHPHNKTMVHLLSGFIKVFQGEIREGLANVETAMWSDCPNSTLFYKTAIDIVVGIIVYDPEIVQPLNLLHSACQLIAEGHNMDPTSILLTLHLKEEDLLPPFQLQWPHRVNPLGIGTRQYEENLALKLRQNRWTAMEAAEAYLDLIAKCHQPVEVAMCFLNASLWLLKRLQEKTSNESALPSDIYSLKMAVIHYLTQAFIVAKSSLHPGMQLYIARIATGASLLAMKLAGIQATSNDAEQIVQFLYNFVHSARLCPFWKGPVILVSEANVLELMTGKQHSTFVSALQHIPKRLCHLKQSELMYQLYENDLTDLHKLDNPQQIKQQAMQELLQEKGLTWGGVSNLMNSSLNLRSSEGWLDIHQPVTMNLDYSEIKGLKVHLGGPSILNPPTLDLLVVPSNGTDGIVSQSDVDTFLTLDPQHLMPLYFSLDPPSRNEKYHPFQGLRYHPNGILNTEVLQTLFEADYIMKFFSIGSEVSANAPFDQRPCIQGLISKLPPHLRAALKPVHEYGELKGNMFRFWIEAKEMKYDIQVSGHEVTVKCGDPDMIIRNHRIYIAPNGKVYDTEDESDPNSPQAQFAANLTKHYDEIGHYFPAFARIKELCKLQLLANYVKNNVVNFESQPFFKSSTFKQMVTEVETTAKVCLTDNIFKKHALPCLWAPAAVYKEEKEDGFIRRVLRCYGGVNLAPHYFKAALPPLPANTQTVSLSKRKLASPQYSSRAPSTCITSSKNEEGDDSSSTSSSSGGRIPTYSSHSFVSGRGHVASQQQSKYTPRQNHRSSTSTSVKATHRQNEYLPNNQSSTTASGQFTPQYHSSSHSKRRHQQKDGSPVAGMNSHSRTRATPYGANHPPTAAFSSSTQPMKFTQSSDSNTYGSGFSPSVHTGFTTTNSGSRPQPTLSHGHVTPTKSSRSGPTQSGQSHGELIPASNSRSQPTQPGQSHGELTSRSRPTQSSQSHGKLMPASNSRSWPTQPGQSHGELTPASNSRSRPTQSGQSHRELTPASNSRSQPTQSGQSHSYLTSVPSSRSQPMKYTKYSEASSNTYGSRYVHGSSNCLQEFCSFSAKQYVQSDNSSSAQHEFVLPSLYSLKQRIISTTEDHTTAQHEVIAQVLEIPHRELPIAKAFLSQMLKVFPLPSTQSHTLWGLPLQVTFHDSSETGSNTSEKHQGGNGNDGSGGPPSDVVAGVILKLKTSYIRDRSSQKKFSDQQKLKGKCTEGMEAAHILSLEVAIDVVRRATYEGLIKCTNISEVYHILKKALNVFDNYELASCHENRIVHRRIDKALKHHAAGCKTYSSASAEEREEREEREKKIVTFFENHLLRLIPLQLVKIFLDLFFRPLNLISQERADEIIKQKENETSCSGSCQASWLETHTF